VALPDAQIIAQKYVALKAQTAGYHVVLVAIPEKELPADIAVQ
jgi:hypothetical protein